MPFGIPDEDFNDEFELPDEEVVCTMEGNTEKLIDDLNYILKDNFAYVPLFRVINIAEELAQRGWKFNK